MFKGQKKQNQKQMNKNVQKKPRQRGQKRKQQKQGQNPRPQKRQKTRRNMNHVGFMTDGTNYSQRAVRDSVLISKSEPIGIIASNDSANFGVLATYAINPGNAVTFSILSQEAAVYETYLFESLEFYTVPLVSEYAAGGQTGEVAIAVNFNASLPPPATQTAQLTLEPVAANLPCLPLRINCPKTIMHKQSNAKYVRTGGLPGQSDIKEYDVGNLFLTGEGLSATQFNVCRLFVRYNCRLFTRVNLVNQGAPANNSVTYLTDTTSGTIVSQVDYTCTFAQAATANFGSVNGLNVVNTNGVIVPPAGNYLLDINLTANDATTADIDNYSVKVKKNNNVLNLLNTFTAANIQSTSQMINCAIPFFVTMNGTDSLSVIIDFDYSGGTLSTVTTLRLVAI